MRPVNQKVLSLCCTALLVLASGQSAQADDTEIFFTTTVTGGNANLMLILDTSGSMHQPSTVTIQPYDSTLTYSLNNTGDRRGNNKCQAGYVYYRTDDPLSTTPPDSCVGLSSFTYNIGTPANTDNKCKASQTPLQYGSGYSGRAGYFQDRFIRWYGSSNNNKTWNASLAQGSVVECRTDAGTDGNLAASTSTTLYPRSGTTTGTTGRWGTLAQQWWSASNTGTEYVLWSPNIIGYQSNPPLAASLTRMEVVKAAATSLLTTISDMNVGLMRYDSEANGGMVMAPALPIDEGSNRTNLINLINGFVEAGSTPLSETLFEAYRYFSGGNVEYGNNSHVCSAYNVNNGNAQCNNGATSLYPSVPAARTPATTDGAKYDSPADASCQNNYVVYLTDGEPTSDNGADSLIEGLPSFSTIAGTCTGNGAGRCLGALAQYMYNPDNNADGDLRTDVDGIQKVKSYFIGFGNEFAGSNNSAFDYLKTAATRGGGQAYQAGDTAQLEGAFNSIISDVVDTNTTFTSPTVAVNAFNRTQTLSDLYVSVFQPSITRHWPGNLKKYAIDNGVIEDQNGVSAINPLNGFFKDTARSQWSTVNDGYLVTKGGAAAALPSPSTRTIYTYIGTNPANPSTAPVNLTVGTNYLFDVSNGNITNSVLGIGQAGDPTLADLVNWGRGLDVRDKDPSDGNATQTRHIMGDPLHSQPAVVIYGGTVASPSLNDAVIYLPTNDGYVHAVDTVSGVEMWSFIPQEVLPQLKSLYQDQTSTTKQYTLDGEIQVLKYDVNGDGIITSSANDRVILFFSQGRGGNKYYALDVTNKNQPKYMWTIDSSVLPGVGQSWSKPTIARVNIQGASQNSQKLVLIMGGGYDVAEDGSFYVTSASTGNRLYMVDALKGTLLWSAGYTTSTADLKLARMNHSIPSAVAVMDTNQDGFADRMYVGDMAAQLWRFDITNGNARNALVAGGVMASLGSADESPHTEANARRFYNPPDVAAIQQAGHLPFLNIAIGSGYRGHPLNLVNRDRFYSVRDLKPFTVMTQTQYDAVVPLQDTDLQDITTDTTPTIPLDSQGWKLNLNQPGGNWVGEKVLSAANTFDNKIFFTTYRPTPSGQANSCTSNSAGSGKNRAFIVNVFDGAPIKRLSDSEAGESETDTRPEDRYTDLAQGGIAPAVSFLFPSSDGGSGSGSGASGSLICLSGVEVLGACTDFNSRLKTYWRESSAN